MPVNFNVLRREGPMGFYEGLEQGQQVAAQNALAQQKMAQDRETNALNRQKAQVEMETARLGQERTRAQMAATEEDRARARRVERTGMYRERLLRAPNAEAARAVVQQQYADPELAPVLSQFATLEQALSEVPDDPVQFDRYRQQEVMGMSEWMKSQLPKTVGNAIYLPSEGRFVTPHAAPKEPTTPSPVLEYQFARTPEGGSFAGSYQEFLAGKQQQAQDPLIRQYEYAQKQGFKGSLFDYKRSIAEAGRPPAAPREAAGQKAPAGYRFTSGGDLEPIPGGPASPGLAPKDIQKREAAFPQAKQAVSTVRNTMSVIKETIDRLLENEAGLNGVTGLIGGITPGLTDAARQAVADLDQLKNLAFIQGITELRNASKTGAGVGNVSNKEGDRFENLKASLARSQSLKSMKDALKRLRDQADITDTTIQDAFDETYEYRTQRGAGGGGAAAPAAGGNTVTLPDGRVMTFPNAKAAADFKKAARLP